MSKVDAIAKDVFEHVARSMKRRHPKSQFPIWEHAGHEAKAQWRSIARWHLKKTKERPHD